LVLLSESNLSMAKVNCFCPKMWILRVDAAALSHTLGGEGKHGWLVKKCRRKFDDLLRNYNLFYMIHTSVQFLLTLKRRSSAQSWIDENKKRKTGKKH